MVTTRTGHWEYDAVRDDDVPAWNRLDEADTKPVLDAAVERLTADTPFHVNLMDGSRIAGSCAATNPSMRIAALAEHSMDTILRQDRELIG